MKKIFTAIFSFQNSKKLVERRKVEKNEITKRYLEN